MTLFALAAAEETIRFGSLDRWCGGRLDEQTLTLVGGDA
jgi:uncharacterized protein (DUF1810 family)